MMRPGFLAVTVVFVVSLQSPLPGEGFTVISWGDNSAGQTNVPLYLTNAVAVAGGAEYSLALKEDGTVVGWGGNAWGQTTIPDSATNVTAIVAGYYHSLALRRDGTVVGWGRNSEGQATVPDDATNVIAIAAGPNSSLALLQNGRVLAWGDNQYGQTNVPTSGKITKISCGYHSLGLRTNKTVEGWGYNFWGQADGTSAGSNVVAIAAGVLHSLALKEDGSVRAWGRNFERQANVPVALSNVVAIAGGLEFSMALTGTGKVVAWGRNLDGETNVPSGLSHVIAIAAGVSHGLALTTDLPVYPPPPPGVDQVPRLSLKDPASGEFDLEYSASMTPGVQWDSLVKLAVSNSSACYLDESAIGASQRFYRLASSNIQSSVGIDLVPRLTLHGDIGEGYRLEYRTGTGTASSWALLEIVIITNNPQYYYDVSATGRQERIYRLAVPENP